MCAAMLRYMPPRLDEPDTIIFDVEEQEADMQVLLVDSDGRTRWHRVAALDYPDHTACGRRFSPQREQLGLRASKYEGALCEGGCFTSFEISKQHRRTSITLTWPSDEKKGP